MDLQEIPFRIKLKRMHNSPQRRVRLVERQPEIKLCFVLFLLILNSCEPHLNKTDPEPSESQKYRQELIFKVHAIDFSDSLPVTSLLNYEKARYYLSLLDSLDKYDPLTDTSARVLSWYGEYSLDTTSWSKTLTISTSQDKTKDILECSDRYKLLWYAHLSLMNNVVDTVRYPYVIYTRSRNAAISYDKVLICDEPSGKHYHGIKQYNDHYLTLKALYWKIVIEQVIIDQIPTTLNSKGFQWKIGVK